MPGGKKDGAVGGSGGPRAQNGNRSGFRTDTAISNSRPVKERTLERWVPDSNDAFDGSLEKPSNSNKGWDQFAENERLFGVKSDYDENIYTTAINKSHPQFRERMAAADKKALEIQSSVASTTHVAEERVMDYVGGADKDDDEESKYSGVRRQDMPASEARENKYTPPAMRPPAGHSTVKGAPVDPAIISSQLKAPSKKQPATSSEEAKSRTPDAGQNGVSPNADAASPQVKSEGSKLGSPSGSQPADKTVTPGRNSTSNSRALSPQATEGTPNATSTVERDVLNSFKIFAGQQREVAQKARSSKAKADKEVKLTELKKFASNFKLSTPVPGDLVSIIAKDPAKQKEIQEKAKKNAEEMKVKPETAAKDKTNANKDIQSKPGEQSSAKVSDNRAPRGPNAPPANVQGGPQNRQGHRQPFPQQQQYSNYGNNRGGPRHGAPQHPQGGHLGQRLRNIEQNNKFAQPASEGRVPPAGPSGISDANYRRLSGVPTPTGPKLNPTTHEFRPNAFAAPFNPAGHPSTNSSPRSAANQVSEPAAPTPGVQLIRRKTKAVNRKKCCILSHIKTVTPPKGRNWDDNGGMRPSYDTLPTWRQLQDDEKPDSTMHLTYKQYFDRQPFSGSTMATPNPPHVVPHMAHQHQLPLHLQHSGPNMGPRQSPHMSHMPMAPQHGPSPHQPYGHDDHRMVHSNSAQSFASPRLGQAAMAYPGMNAPGQVPYNQPVYMAPGTPQMNQYRSFSNNPSFMPPQQGQMGGPMMMQPPYMAGPQGMVGGPQMMYGGHPHFMPPGGPPQPGPGANGYPSPGRPTAPMMAHQGSQQGQPMYGMSPNVQYSQPAYGHGQQQPGGPMSQPRGYNSAGPQQYGTSPQQAHQHSAPHQQRTGSNTYNRNQGVQGQQQQQQQPPSQPQQSSNSSQTASSTSRGAEGSDEAK